MSFPFNQPPKTHDCGYRCLYYVLRTVWGWGDPYEEWLELFRFFQPTKSGIKFADMCTLLNFHQTDFKFTQLARTGLFIVYSGVWLRPEGKNHGHYIVYQDGVVYCSTRDGPYLMPLDQAVARLEATTVEGAFRCLQVVGPKNEVAGQ